MWLQALSSYASLFLVVAALPPNSDASQIALTRVFSIEPLGYYYYFIDIANIC